MICVLIVVLRLWIDLINRLIECHDMKPDKNDSDTRARLVAVGLHLFGRNGYEGTSTRAIAAKAQTNVASIAYHFGGKSGLRIACANEVATRIGGVMNAALLAKMPETPHDAQTMIENVFIAFVRMIVGVPQTRDLVAFMLRELTDPGEVADMIYADLLEPKHIGLCALWAKATGQAADDAAVKLVVFSMIGQVLYFRIASPFVNRRLGWDHVGDDELQAITHTVVANLHATIERHRI